MGYTHYWDRPKEINTEKFSAIIKDVKKIITEIPAALANGMGEKDSHSTINETEIVFNGLEDLGHETFHMPRIVAPEDTWNFCKTALKPYDLAVCCCLLIFKIHLKDSFQLSSDGVISEEWQPAVDLVNKTFGLNLEWAGGEGIELK